MVCRLPGCRDHPRVCGEHLADHVVAAHVEGSSPRMRGTRIRYVWNGGHCGIIPAYAGNTYVRGQKVVLDGDHPRVCGEHVRSSIVSSCSSGSSPRMRGTPHHHDCQNHPVGIIPAYAGNTKDLCPSYCGLRDHPRVCGEHPFCGLPWHAPYGIIPAYAGNTPTRTPSATVTGDHPRVCGEHRQGPVRRRSEAGSSPRMRGTPGAVGLGRFGRGIIPAYAGNTWCAV